MLACQSRNYLRLLGSSSLIATALILTGCELPDYQRGQQALAKGDLAEAKRNLSPLAKLGSIEAQIAMGDIASSDTSPNKDKIAEKYYLDALDSGSQKANARLAKLYKNEAESAGVEDARNAIFQIKAALKNGDDSVLPILAEITAKYPELKLENYTRFYIDQFKEKKSLNAVYAEVLWWTLAGKSVEHQKEIEAICAQIGPDESGCYRARVTLYQATKDEEKELAAIAQIGSEYQAKRISEEELVRFSKWLAHKDRAIPRPKSALELLGKIIPASADVQVQIAKIELQSNTGNKTLDDVVKKLTALVEAGNASAVEVLAEMYLEGEGVTPDPWHAERLLNRGENKTPYQHYLLGLIYRDGYLGRPDPKLALDHLLKAARQGVRRADIALARMFWEAKGIRRNKTYAYSFASIAQGSGSNGATDPNALANVINTQLSLEEKTAAEQLKAKELHMREHAPSIDAIIGQLD